MAMAVTEALKGLTALRFGGHTVKTGLAFGNGVVNAFLIKKSPILFLMKIIGSTAVYGATGRGGSIAEAIAVSDAGMLGLITAFMVMKSSPRPVELGLKRLESAIQGVIPR